MIENDEDLAFRARDGDRKALQLLLERHYATAYRLSYRLVGSRADAEDVAQDVCIRLVDRIVAFAGESRFSTWLYAVVLNACRDHFRRQRTFRDKLSGYAASLAQDSADWADSEEKVRWLYRALDGLSPALKETALLILAEDVTQEDAAAILGISPGTVAWRMSEVKKRLRELAKDNDGRI
jgi:RNA polymerase sigma-70 factor (ECF subfamily)